MPFFSRLQEFLFLTLPEPRSSSNSCQAEAQSQGCDLLLPFGLAAMCFVRPLLGLPLSCNIEIAQSCFSDHNLEISERLLRILCHVHRLFRSVKPSSLILGDFS